MRPAQVIVVAVVAYLLAGVSSAAGEAARFTGVALVLPACQAPGLDSAQIRSALSLDLRDESLLLAPAGALSPDHVLLQIGADCAREAELTLLARFGDEEHTRQVDFSELPPEQRARALSLSLAELLSLFEATQVAPSEVQPTNGEPVPAPAAAPSAVESASPAQPQAPKPTTKALTRSTTDELDRAASGSESDERRHRERSRAWQLSVAPEYRAFETTSLWGGRAQVDHNAWSVGIDLLYARASAAPGSVSTYLIHASVARRWALAGDPERSLLEAGPRLGAGRSFMSAEASATAQAASAQDVYADAALAARYSLWISAGFRLGVGAELGYARGPIGYADEVVIARTAGPFAALLLDAIAPL